MLPEAIPKGLGLMLCTVLPGSHRATDARPSEPQLLAACVINEQRLDISGKLYPIGCKSVRTHQQSFGEQPSYKVAARPPRV